MHINVHGLSYRCSTLTLGYDMLKAALPHRTFGKTRQSYTRLSRGEQACPLGLHTIVESMIALGHTLRAYSHVSFHSREAFFPPGSRSTESEDDDVSVRLHSSHTRTLSRRSIRHGLIPLEALTGEAPKVGKPSCSHNHTRRSPRSVSLKLAD